MNEMINNDRSKYIRCIKAFAILLAMILMFIQTACSKPIGFEVSLGIINSEDDLSKANEYQISWIDGEAIVDISDKSINERIDGSGWSFIEAKDCRRLIRELTNADIVYYYPKEVDGLFGLFINRNSYPTEMIPVTYRVVTPSGNGSESGSNNTIGGYAKGLTFDSEAREKILLKLYSAIRQANDAYTVSESYIDNCDDTQKGRDPESLFEGYTVLIKESDNMLISQDSIVGIVHGSLNREVMDDGALEIVKENIEVIPAEGMKIESFGMKLESNNKDIRILRSERYPIEEFYDDEPDGILYAKGNRENNIPKISTWEGSKYNFDGDDTFSISTSFNDDPRKSTAYCLAIKNEIAVYTEDKESIRDALTLSLYNITIKEGMFRSLSWGNAE